MRDYNLEHKDNTRKYAYNFDYILRDYMMQSFLPFLAKGSALDQRCGKLPQPLPILFILGSGRMRGPVWKHPVPRRRCGYRG